MVALIFAIDKMSLLLLVVRMVFLFDDLILTFKEN